MAPLIESTLRLTGNFGENASSDTAKMRLEGARIFWQLYAHAGRFIRYGLLYGTALAGIAVLFQWTQYRYTVMNMPGEAYIAIIAAVFIGIGIWVGMRLTPQRAGEGFERNDKAIAALGQTRRECEILDHMAKGAGNKEIARDLGVSPNTIKTHIANLYLKLEVTGRGKAVEAAPALDLIHLCKQSHAALFTYFRWDHWSACHRTHDCDFVRIGPGCWQHHGGAGICQNACDTQLAVYRDQTISRC